jgi:hypothetical protein
MFAAGSLSSQTICCPWESMGFAWMLRNVRSGQNHSMSKLTFEFADMPSDDIRAIVSKLSRRPYITQELIDVEGTIGGEYNDIGDVQELVL